MKQAILERFSYQHLVGVLFLFFGVYQLYVGAYIDSLLYVSIGLAFIVMAFIKSKTFPKYQTILNYLSWILIVIGCLAFLYILTIAPLEQ